MLKPDNERCYGYPVIAFFSELHGPSSLSILKVMPTGNCSILGGTYLSIMISGPSPDRLKDTYLDRYHTSYYILSVQRT